MFSEPRTGRLASIEIPLFSGEIRDRNRFRDFFKSHVIDVTAYPDSAKVYYLQLYLRGEAAAMVDGIP